MHRHPLDIVSGILGVLTVTLGVLIITGSIDDYDHRGAWWLALAGIASAIAIIPWHGNRAPTPAEKPHAQQPPLPDPEPVTESTTSGT